MLLVAALVVFDIYRHKRVTGFALLCTAVPLSLMLISRFISGSEASYLEQFSAWSLSGVGRTVWFGLVKDLPRLFHVPRSLLPAKYVFSVGALLLSLYGASISVSRRKITVLGFFLILYLALVALWPTYQGLRFLIPALPVFFVGAVLGLHELTARRKPMFRIAAITLAGLVVAAS